MKLEKFIATYNKPADSSPSQATLDGWRKAAEEDRLVFCGWAGVLVLTMMQFCDRLVVANLQLLKAGIPYSPVDAMHSLLQSAGFPRIDVQVPDGEPDFCLGLHCDDGGCIRACRENVAILMATTLDDDPDEAAKAAGFTNAQAVVDFGLNLPTALNYAEDEPRQCDLSDLMLGTVSRPDC